MKEGLLEFRLINKALWRCLVQTRPIVEGWSRKRRAHNPQKGLTPGGGGYLTSFCTGTCHRGFKNIPVPYTNFSKMYTRLYTNFSKIYTRDFIPIFRKCIPDPLQIVKIAKIDTVPHTKIAKIDTLPDSTSPNPKYV